MIVALQCKSCNFVQTEKYSAFTFRTFPQSGQIRRSLGSASFGMCCVFMCLRMSCFECALYSHSSQLWFLICLWTRWTWSRTLFLSLKYFWHSGHANLEIIQLNASSMKSLKVVTFCFQSFSAGWQFRRLSQHCEKDLSCSAFWVLMP